MNVTMRRNLMMSLTMNLTMMNLMNNLLMNLRTKTVFQLQQKAKSCILRLFLAFVLLFIAVIKNIFVIAILTWIFWGVNFQTCFLKYFFWDSNIEVCSLKHIFWGMKFKVWFWNAFFEGTTTIGYRLRWMVIHDCWLI